ncbi:MAG: hypothetical protein AAB579_02865 [Patescibacteria group bacterium]
MTTRFVGLKELRQNMARITNAALKKKERLIVLRKNEPLFELRPLSKKDVILERFLLSIREAEEDVKAGRVYSQEEIEKMFGL